ncbi:MAG: 5-dehydro-2-deoxygluconokinase [Oscillospiraceae bacterium]
MLSLNFDQSKKFDLIPLGRAAIDFNPVDYYQSLEKSSTFKKYVGGSPANIAVGVTRLGKKCGFIGKLADDQFGRYIKEFFEKEGIDTSHLTPCKNGEKTGLTFTEILSKTDSSILMYRDQVADLALDVADVDESYVANTKILLISGTALAQSPSREAALKALMLAKRNNVRVVFDIDYRPYNWKNTDEISAYYGLVAAQSDIIIGSREEFDLTERLLCPGNDDKQSAAFWFGHGCKIVIIKHGKQGSFAYTADNQNYCVKPFPIEKLKSFGGGDGYGSAFLFGLLEGWPVADCLELGSASASLLVAAHACSEFMPTLAEVQQFIRQIKEQYGEMVSKVE